NYVEKANQQSKDFENQSKDLQDKYDVLKNQTTTFEMNNNELNEQMKELIEMNNDLLAQTKVLKDQLQVKHVVIDTHDECQEKNAKLKAERYEYMIIYSTNFDNHKQHRKQIADQQVLYDKMSVQLVELDKHVRDLKNMVLEKDFKISELEECTVHMIMPSKDNLYNGRKGIGFENPSYFEKAKYLRPTLYDEKVIGLGYTLMFLTHSDEAWEIEKFKRSRENKIEFAYDYGNLNASYVNEKINFEDDYFQEIINLNFDKIDSLFQQTSSLKPYIPNVIIEKIIIDLEDEVVSLLEKEKENLETIESLKSKGFDSSETVSSESKNQSENDCHVVEKQCGNMESSKVIAPGMFKLNVSQCVSPISMSKLSCDSNNVQIKLKKETVSNLNNDVKRYSHKDLLACNNSHLGETSSAFVCNDAMNVSCDSRMNDLLDDNNFFIFDYVNVRISLVSKMFFRKKPRDSMHVIGLGYTLMFLTHSDEALEIEKFKRSGENKIEFAYDYGNLNASYVNEKINFEDDYFQEIINLDFEKIDSPFHENNRLVVEKECDKEENPKVIAPRIFKLSVSQCVSPISKSKSSCDSNNVKIKLKRKRRKRKSSKQNVKQVDNEVSRANSNFVHFSDLDTFSSVRRPKNSGVIWKKKGSSNTPNVVLSAISVSNLNKNVKRYSRKDLLEYSNSHLGETRSDFVCNEAMNVSCDSRMNDLLDDNNFFIFDDVNVKISPVSKMHFRKKPRDSMHVCSKSNMNKSLPRTVHKWRPKLQPLAKPVAKWFPRVKRQIDKISKTPNSPGPIYKWVPKVC
nr:hypothetical protein [Tanacetum cinerariifolium]